MKGMAKKRRRRREGGLTEAGCHCVDSWLGPAAGAGNSAGLYQRMDRRSEMRMRAGGLSVAAWPVLLIAVVMVVLLLLMVELGMQ